MFTAKDGHLVIAAQVDAAWKRFARLAGGDAFAADARLHSAAGRNEHRLEILPVVRAWVAQLTVADALVQLEASDVTATCRTPAPLLGQHNREVASLLGYSPGEIDAMARDGVLYSEPQP